MTPGTTSETAPPATRDDLTRGVLLMTLAVALLTVMDALVKHLLEGGVHLMELLFIRSVLIGSGVWLVYSLRGSSASLLPVNRRGQAARALFGVLAPICFFSGLALLPLTDATVVGYASTFSTVALSAWLLGERVGPLRWAGVAVGYAGVIVAIDPERAEGSLGHLLVLLAALALSAFHVIGKRLVLTETPMSLVLCYNLALGLLALGWLPFVWRTPTLVEGLFVVLFALLAVGGQWCLTRAFALADVSVIAPLEYTSLVWVVALDAAVWNIAPEARVLAGAAIVIAACLFVFWRERLASRRALGPGG